MVKETTFITKLHSNECLENTFGQITIMPSINEEVSKRDKIMNFVDKILAFNPKYELKIQFEDLRKLDENFFMFINAERLIRTIKTCVQ